MFRKGGLAVAVLVLGVAALAAPMATVPTGYTGAATDWYGPGIKMDPGDWPQWRGPMRDGVSTETNLLDKWPENGPPLAWKMTGIGRGLAAIVVLKGRFYMVGDRENTATLQCYNLADQKPIWACKVGPKWNDGERASPAIDGDALFGMTGEGDVYCVGLDGKLRWTKSSKRDFGGSLMNPQYGYTQTPLVDDKRVIVNPGGKENCVVALDRDTGVTIWKIPAAEIKGERGHDGAAYSSPVITEGGGLRHYVFLVGRGLVGINPKDGKVLWIYNKMAHGEANIPTPIIRGDYVFDSVGYDAGTCCLKLSPDGQGGVKAEEVWYLTPDICQNLEGQSALVGDYVYTTHAYVAAYPVCIELATGKVMWKNKEQVGRGVAGMTSADGKVILRAESGEVSMFEASPKAYNLISIFKPDDGSKGNEQRWAHPVVSHGLLFIRQHDVLVAYDLRKK